MDLLSSLKGPDRRCVETASLRIQMAGPGPNAEPVLREDLVEDLRSGLAWLRRKGGDPEKVYRRAMQIEGSGRWPGLPSPLVPHPLPSFEEVAP